MSDATTQAQAIAKSMVAAAEESGAFENARISVTPDLKAHIVASLARYYESLFAPSEGDAPGSDAAANDKITAQAFFWGWRLNVPHSQVKPLLDGSEVVSKILEIGLDVIPEVGEILGLVVNAYVAVMGGVIKAVDKGNGVYLNQSWAIELVIIASGGILAGPALLAAFIPTTRH